MGRHGPVSIAGSGSQARHASIAGAGDRRGEGANEWNRRLIEMPRVVELSFQWVVARELMPVSGADHGSPRVEQPTGRHRVWRRRHRSGLGVGSAAQAQAAKDALALLSRDARESSPRSR